MVRVTGGMKVKADRDEVCFLGLFVLSLCQPFTPHLLRMKRKELGGELGS